MQRLTFGIRLLRSQRVKTSPTPPSIGEVDKAVRQVGREVRRLLDLHRGQWKDIADATEVSHSWLSKFMCGKIRNPGYSALHRLYWHLSARKVPPIVRKAPARRRKRKAAAAAVVVSMPSQQPLPQVADLTAATAGS